MKGITPVIAIILLLLITVSMAGFAFIFLQRSLETTASSTEESLQNQLNQQNQRAAIITGNNTHVTMRVSGTVALPVGSIAVLINGTVSGVGSCPDVTTAPGAIFSCPVAVAACGGGSTLRISAPGGPDSIIC